MNMGQRASNTSAVTFEDVVVPDANRLGILCSILVILEVWGLI